MRFPNWPTALWPPGREGWSGSNCMSTHRPTTAGWGPVQHLYLSSGYVLAKGLVLTAAHVLTDAGVKVGQSVQVSVLGSGWIRAAVRWLGSGGLDAAVLEAADDLVRPGVYMLRWGRIARQEPVTTAAQRPDVLRDTEHVVGFVAPG